MKGSALASVAAAIVDTTVPIVFDSAQQALAVRDVMYTQLSDFLESDEVSSALVLGENTSPNSTSSIEAVAEAFRNLRTTLNRHLTQVAGALPRIVNYEPAETLPAVVIAYRLYADASRAREIEDRNKSGIRNPMFVPGKTTIEVVSSV
jgi:prophage DNA circulation protein